MRRKTRQCQKGLQSLLKYLTHHVKYMGWSSNAQSVGFLTDTTSCTCTGNPPYILL